MNSSENINNAVNTNTESEGVYWTDGVWFDKRTLDIYTNINDAVSSVAADAFRRLIPTEEGIEDFNAKLDYTMEIWSKTAAILISKALTEFKNNNQERKGEHRLTGGYTV